LDDEAVGPGRNDERADLARSGPRRHRDERRDRCARVRDERLLAVEHPLVGVVVVLGPRARGPGVAAAVRFGEAEAAERRARAEIRQPPLPLRLRAEAEDGVGAETDTRLERDGHRRIDATDLLDGDAQRREAGARTAVLLGERETEQAELAHREHGVDGKRVVAVPRLRVRRDLGGREVADDAAECLVLRAQFHRHSRNRTLRR
jgi:hypothetical protein